MAESIRPVATEFESICFDGETPLRRAAHIRIQDGFLDIELADVRLSWPLKEIRVTADGRYGEPVRIEHRGGKLGECLETEDRGLLAAIREREPSVLPRDFLIGDLQSWPSVVVAGLLILLIGAVAMSWVAPVVADYAALVMPRSVEERLGRAVVNLWVPAAARCTHEEREALLNRIAERLTGAAESEYEFRILYSSHPISNAFAAPGGYIVVFQGLLHDTETPEELAAVLAHEITHVTQRHSTRALARHVSARTLLNLMSMDSAGTPTAMRGVVDLSSLAYQRADEDKADLGAVALLARARIQPNALSSFFRRLQSGTSLDGGAISYFSSHPALYERADRVDAAAREYEVEPEPLLTEEEWKLVRYSCMAPDRPTSEEPAADETALER